jgi:hypothetical protein
LSRRAYSPSNLLLPQIFEYENEVGNPVRGMGQAPTCGGVKTLYGDPNPPFLLIGSPMAI